MKHGTDDAREGASGALRNLAQNSDNHVAIAQAVAIPLLVELVKNGAYHEQVAAAALGDLALNDNYQVAIILVGGIPPLVELVKNGSAAAKEIAVVALKNLAQNCPYSLESIHQPGGTPPLVELSQTEGTEARTAATMLLEWIRRNTSYSTPLPLPAFLLLLHHESRV